MLTPDEAAAAYRRCSNAGRWGPHDELGTLNLITPEVRRRAAALVTEGVSVSLAADIDTVQSAVNPQPAWHVMHLETARPFATADSIHLAVHGFGTHLDALGHVFFDGMGYGDRPQGEVVADGGLTVNSVLAMRDGIFTRGVLLDVAAVCGVEFLPPGHVVSPSELEAAEGIAGLRVEAGDAIFVHTGLERRARTEEPAALTRRAGLGLAAVEWLHHRDVAVYSGDCVEILPSPDPVLPLPLHQIGIGAMGLVLLDWPVLTGVLAAAARYQRWAFLLTVAPLRIPGGTGSPVNPIATF